MKTRLIIVISVCALAVCYAPILAGMWQQWSLDEDMGHGFVVAPVAVWIAWRERDKLQDPTPKPSPWGLVLLAAGFAAQAASVVGAGLFAGAVGFLLSTAGIVLALGGFKYLRVWAFPLCLTLFMLPKLAVLYNMGTLPLQLGATRIAHGILTLAGYAVQRDGNLLSTGSWQVAVVEACNGLRYLLTLGFVGAVYAYLSDPKPWMRAALIAAAVPIAILANALRVAVTVALGSHNPKWAGEPYHTVLGWFVFVICMGAVWATQKALSWAHGRVHA